MVSQTTSDRGAPQLVRYYRKVYTFCEPAGRHAARPESSSPELVACLVRIQRSALRHRKWDVFEFADGKQISLNDLPAGLIFDVLVVPGSEQLSAVLNMEPAVQDEEEGDKERFLARLMAHF